MLATVKFIHMPAEPEVAGYELDKKGLNTKIYLAVDAHGMLVKILVTPGVTTDCTQVRYLIEEVGADYLLADRGYDSNAIIDLAKKQKMEIVIPPKKDRKIKTSNDKALYELRHLVENAFLHFKRWSGVATRYAKNTSSFLAAVQIRCITLWAGVS